MTYGDELIRAVGDVEIPPGQESPDRELAHVMFALLACALAKLSPDEREEMLRAVEDGALRDAVAQYPNAERAAMTPEYPNERLN